MSDYIGNAGLHLPGQFIESAEVKPSNIFGAKPETAIIKGATLKAGQGVLTAGRALALETATKKYVIYNNGGSGGAETCVGFLLETTDTTAADTLANVVLGGTLKNSALSGLDANGITDLNGRADTARDLFIF